MWRVVGDRVGLPRHDMEVEGVVVKDDAVLELRVRCCTCNVSVKPLQATARRCAACDWRPES